MATEIVRRAFTVAEYARMRESGILTEDDRVELIDGEIRTMSPIGPLHAAIVRRIVKQLTAILGDTAIVSPQCPVQLNDYSEPEPDVAVLRFRDDNYETAHPGSADVLLIIEVSDTSVDYDRNEKLPRYAAASIGEVWIVDIDRRTVEQYSQATHQQYARMQKVFAGEVVTSIVLAQISVPVDAILS